MKSLFPRVSIFALPILTLTSMAHANTVWPGLRGPSYDGAVHDAQLFEGEGEKSDESMEPRARVAASPSAGFEIWAPATPWSPLTAVA